jgi:transposase
MLSFLKASPPVSPNDRAESLGQFAIHPADREVLLRWARGSSIPHRAMIRSGLVLMADAGWTNTSIAAQLGISRRTVAFWKARYRLGGARAILVDAPGRGRKPGRDTQIVSKILIATKETPPPASRWTLRTLARAVGVSHATVQRVWREHGITQAPTRP